MVDGRSNSSTNLVLIKKHASGLCYTDVHITEGLFPRTKGHEPVSEIVEVGDGVITLSSLLFYNLFMSF